MCVGEPEIRGKRGRKTQKKRARGEGSSVDQKFNFILDLFKSPPIFKSVHTGVDVCLSDKVIHIGRV